MTDPRILGLLRAARPGAVLWLSSSGKSLWPLVLSGDLLQVERITEDQLEEGDIAVVARGGTLVAHIVVRRQPLVTASTAGVEDPPGGEPLGRVMGVKRAGVVLPDPRTAAPVLRWWPAAARVAKRLRPVRWAARRLRDGSGGW